MNFAVCLEYTWRNDFVIGVVLFRPQKCMLMEVSSSGDGHHEYRMQCASVEVTMVTDTKQMSSDKLIGWCYFSVDLFS